jgi:acetyl esterase/lipase
MASAALNAILQQLRSGPSRAGQSLADLRKAMEDTAAPVPPDVQCTPVQAATVPCEWIAAPGADPQRVLLFFHGGGYYRGSIRTHREFCARLSRASGTPVLAVDYRLAPEHRFPAAVDDCVAAWRWLMAQGSAPGNVAVVGDSAGGGLALALLMTLRDEQAALPAAAVLLSPWTDLLQSGASMAGNAPHDPTISKAYLDRFAAAYLHDADPKHPLASPLFGDLRGLPPLLIQVGAIECLLDDATRLAQQASAAGVTVDLEVWPGMFHVWQRHGAQLPEAQQAVDKIGATVRAALGASRKARSA